MEFTNLHIQQLPKARSSWMYPIYIPSWNRAGTAPLLNMLSDAPAVVQRKVHIIVRPDQHADYVAAYPWAKIIHVHKPGLGPARTQGWLHARYVGHKRIVMMDDDIKHLSLLERIPRDGRPHSRRYSSRVSGVAEPMNTIKALAVACKMADVAFAEVPNASYGAARNALFSGDVQTKVGAEYYKGSFPSCVFFFDVERYTAKKLPPEYHFHGEDLAICLTALKRGQIWFTLPAVAYDQDGNIESMIPLDPLTEQGRQADIDNALIRYPDQHPYLRSSYKNKLGGVMRIGIKWAQFHKDNNTTAITVPMDEMFS